MTSPITPCQAPIQAVIFDMDGLMIDSERITFEGYQQYCRQYGHVLDRPTYLLCLGKPVRDVAEVFYQAFGRDFPFPSAVQATHARMAKVFEEQGVPVKPGLKPLLTRLHEAGIPCALATSSDRHRVDRILELAGLQQDFAAIICGDEVRRSKPAPDIFLKAAEALHVEPAHCLVLEDSEMGILAADTGGLPVICIPDMKEPEPDYARRCAAILPSLDQAAEWIFPAEV